MTTRIIGLDQARRELSGMVNGMDRGHFRYLLSARGRPKAVLMSVSDFMMTVLRQKRATIVAELQLDAKAKGSDKLSEDEIQDEIRAARRARR